VGAKGAESGGKERQIRRPFPPDVQIPRIVKSLNCHTEAGFMPSIQPILQRRNSVTITTTNGQNRKILNMSTAPLPNIASHGTYGAIIVMNAFVAPSSATDYLKLSAPIVERFRKEPECLFCELSQNPEDPGHIRIVHGWTKDTEWLRQVSGIISNTT
jgi:hypothetical protein